MEEFVGGEDRGDLEIGDHGFGTLTGVSYWDPDVDRIEQRLPQQHCSANGREETEIVGHFCNAQTVTRRGGRLAGLGWETTAVIRMGSRPEARED